jgi:hypothetical protein
MVETVNRLVAPGPVFASGAQEQLPHLIWLQHCSVFRVERF